jgi:flagellar operon protein
MSDPINNPALVPPGIGPNAPVRERAQPVRPDVVGPAFSDVLRQKQQGGIEPIQFSKHALQRLERRQLEVDGATIGRLGDGLDRAASKGSRDAVVLVDDTAFVVSVKNRTVITAVGRDQMKDHVFTNIDSAVIA